MKKLNILIFIAFASFQSCSRQSSDQEIDKWNEIKVSLSEHEVEHNSLLSSLRIIPLETTDESLIRDVWQIKYKDSLFFISDSRERLLVFDSKGRFLRQIGRQGNGPGEFLGIRDMIVGDGWIELLDFNKIHRYNWHGEYLSSTKIEIKNSDIICIPRYFAKSSFSGYYIWGGLQGIPQEKLKTHKQMYRFSDNFEVLDGYFPITHRQPSNGNRFFVYDDKVIVEPLRFDYNVYQIDTCGMLSSRHYIDFGEQSYHGEINTPEEFEALWDKYVLEMFNYFEVDNWFHLSFFYKDTCCTLYYDKRAKKPYVIDCDKTNKDKNSFPINWVRGCMDEDFIMVFNSFELIEYMQVLSEEVIDKYQLRDIMQTVQESDNPVLVICRLK